MTPQETLSALKKVITKGLGYSVEPNPGGMGWDDMKFELHHVLRVIGQIIKKYHVEIVSGEDGLGKPGSWAVFYNKNARIEQGFNVYWNLAVGLDQQSPETLTFLLNLLT